MCNSWLRCTSSSVVMAMGSLVGHLIYGAVVGAMYGAPVAPEALAVAMHRH